MASDWRFFLQQCEEAVQRFHAQWGTTAVPFFRGHRDASWSLKPGALRDNFRSYAEQSIYYEFRSSAKMLLGNTTDPWEILFAMQHHGLQTRLLDWTGVFTVALYFAVHKPFETACIWMLDPYKLNEISFNQDEILDIQNDFPHNYFDYFVTDNKDMRHEFPADVVAIFPPHSNPRLAAQRGMFTIHGTAVSIATDPKFSGCIQKFELSSSGRDEALNFLSLAGVNDFSLFPDLDGLCRHLSKRFERLSK